MLTNTNVQIIQSKSSSALGTQKRPLVAVFFGAQMGPSTPPPLCGCPRGGDWRKTPRLPPVSVFPLSLAIFHLSTVIPAFSRPWAPPRYPLPNLSPEPKEIELVQISEASRKERPQVLIPPLGGGTRRQKPPPARPDGPYLPSPPKVAAPCSRGSAHDNS